MCGIAAVIGGGQAGAGVASMVEALRHRGPDDSGSRQPPGTEVVLGCARLAIIDLSPAGHMPMEDPATGNVIAYNGEVYNFLELRRDFERDGEAFLSGTDTEVLLRAYAKWGPDFVVRLRGMFAFALWDAGRREILLARDRLGEKPLYYRPGPPFVAASEIRALLASGLVERRLDPVALDSYLVNGFVVSPHTILKGVRSLLPGHLLTVGEHGRVLGERRYWQLPVPASGDSRPDVAALRSELARSVGERLISDVPLGAFLSGGLDSTTVVGLMAAAGGEVRTFSITFDDPVYDESEHSRRAAARFGTRHTEVRLTRPQFEANVDEGVAALDQPSFDGLNTYFVSRAARESGLTVALSGTGADELFGGYPFFSQVKHLAAARRLATGASNLTGSAAAWLARRVRRVSGAGKLLDLFDAPVPSGMETVAAYQVSQTLFPRWSRDRLVTDEVGAAAATNWRGLPEPFLAALQQEVAGCGSVDATSRVALRLFLGERCLRDADATSMAVSLEVRAPFVDHAFVEAALAVPAPDRCAGVPDKPFEWDLAAPILGKGHTRRRKQGFIFPFERWLRDEGRARALSAVLVSPDRVEAAGLRPDGVRDVLAPFFAGSTSVPWSRPWSLFVLLQWCERHRVHL
jgi:asparagine synthase (glutamine-hydrolysing)